MARFMSISNSIEAACRLAVRLGGGILLLFGLVLSCAVLWEAWSIYKDPARIENFSAAVEQGMRIDATLYHLLAPKSTNNNDAALPTPTDNALEEEEAVRTSSAKPAMPMLSISYLLGCIILLLLLLLIAHIALSTVRTGAQLILQHSSNASKS